MAPIDQLIRREIYKAIESLGGPPELLAATISGASKEVMYDAAVQLGADRYRLASIGSWGDTLTTRTCLGICATGTLHLGRSRRPRAHRHGDRAADRIASCLPPSAVGATPWTMRPCSPRCAATAPTTGYGRDASVRDHAFGVRVADTRYITIAIS
jgi:hypothetical protein